VAAVEKEDREVDKMKTGRFPIRRDAGFTLIEALIALVVLAVGLLGIAALYVESLRASRSALYRTQAVVFATDLADRIRANRNACTAGGCAYEGVGALTATCETTAGCTPAQLAANDLKRWLDTGAGALPGFAGSVDFTAGTPNQYVILVQWIEAGVTDPASYTLRVQI
jgi:type IV pilus assembly protein PilV